MILYISGIGTVYFVGNVTVVATAKEEHQGTVSGVYNMFLNVGGAVLGVAVLTVISDSVTSNNGGKSNHQAVLDGYRAGYSGAIAMTAIGLVISFFFTELAGKEQEEKQTAKERSLAADTTAPVSAEGSVKAQEKGTSCSAEPAKEEE